MNRAVVSMLIVWLLFATCAAYPSPQPQIGVLIQNAGFPNCKENYVFGAYKSFIEQGGGGVVAVYTNQSDEYYNQLIPRLNGVLVPGGGISDIVTSPFGKAAAKIRDMAMSMNDKGVHYPLWGTCQGFEVMATWPTNSEDVLSKCVGTDVVSLPVNFTSAANGSKLYGQMSADLRNIMSKENVTANNHDRCLTTNTFHSTPKLNQFFDVLSTNLDGNGLEFVSSVEAKEYPFYGVQFHPEKNNFWHEVGSTYNHSPNANLVSQFMANFLVAEANLNSNSFRSLEEESRFILNGQCSMFYPHNFVEIYCLYDKDIPPFDK